MVGCLGQERVSTYIYDAARAPLAPIATLQCLQCAQYAWLLLVVLHAHGMHGSDERSGVLVVHLGAAGRGCRAQHVVQTRGRRICACACLCKRPRRFLRLLVPIIDDRLGSNRTCVTATPVTAAPRTVKELSIDRKQPCVACRPRAMPWHCCTCCTATSNVLFAAHMAHSMATVNTTRRIAAVDKQIGTIVVSSSSTRCLAKR